MILSSREVLQLHVDLRDRLANPQDVLSRLLDAYAADALGQSNSVSQVVSMHVRHGRTYHVEPQMNDLIRRRADDLERYPVTHQFGHSEAPFSLGLCLFDEPWAEREVRGRIQRSLALSWGPAVARFESGASTRHGAFLVWWGHSTRAPDDMHEEQITGRSMVPSTGKMLDPKGYADLNRRTGGWAITGMDFVPHDSRVGDIRIWPTEAKLAQAAREGWTPWPDGTHNYARQVCALWDLMGETRSVVASETKGADLDRMTRKFARRNKIGTDITTLTLRREDRPTLHPGTGTPLAWRVPVNGHNRTYHRDTPDEFTIFINDHERGPKDAPLRVTRKVHRLAR